MRRRIGEAWTRIAQASRPRTISPALLFAALLLGAATWAWQQRDLPWLLETGDAFEYAEMARRLAHGEGFTTGVVYPAELWLGAGRDHPAVKFPPLWPLLLAGPFALFGADSRTALAVMGVLFAALVATSGALATRLAGRGAGALAALAVATSPLLLSLSIDGISEIPFALAVTAVFLLCAREAPPALVGGVCGLAYLTRYNGAVLLPMVLALLAARRAPPRSLLVCAGCFGLVALPWWIRNAFVTGSPFYSLLNLNLYIAPVMTRVGGSLFFQLEPNLQSGVAADPLEKLLEQLPLLLLQFPLASANLAAFVGVVLACWRRDALSLGLAFCAGATLLVVSLALALGRYFAPFLPAMLALGVAGFVRYGGRGRALGLVLVLLAPLLPSLPAELPDVALIRGWPAWARERASHGWQAPPASGCLADRPLVIAQEAARIAWQHDLVAIYAPIAPGVIRQIAASHPVGFAWLPDPQRVPSEGFRPRPDCGAGWYETPGSP